nr:PEGA domain-containing protein [uncultured Draconibacterium sp.]
MKGTNMIVKYSAFIVAVIILLSGCKGTTMIQSVPSAAKVFLDDQYVGDTPYKMTDTKIVGTETDVVLKMEGYEDLNTSIKRNEKADVEAIIGGVFVLVPFLWVMEYNPVHEYTLTPVE